MSTLKGRSPAESFKNLLHIERGVGDKLRPVEDGSGNTSALALSEDKVSVQGNFEVTGSVNGVDFNTLARTVADHGKKLTGKDLKAMYEENADTNAYRDEDVKKLQSIQSGADKTTAQVIIDALKNAVLRARLTIQGGLRLQGDAGQFGDILSVSTEECDVFTVDAAGTVVTKGGVNGRNMKKDGIKLDNIQKDAQKNDGKIKVEEGQAPGFLIDKIQHGDNIKISVVDGVMHISAEVPEQVIPAKLQALMDALEIDSEGNITTAGKVNGVNMRSDAGKVREMYALV